MQQHPKSRNQNQKTKKEVNKNNMNLEQFVIKYGTFGASSIIRQLISIGITTNGLSTKQDIKLCNQIANDLQDALNEYQQTKNKEKTIPP